MSENANLPAAREESLPTVPSANPMELLDRAVASGASIEVMRGLMELQERWEKNQARKAFDRAMALAKSKIPVIVKNRKVAYDARDNDPTKRTEYWHEDLAEIVETITPHLAAQGLSHRFRTHSVPNEPIVVTCIISHRDGHFEENTLQGPRDDSGKKNALQQIGSTVTYLQRYTLKAALGLAAAKDDDGQAAGGGDEPATITDEQRDNIQRLLDETLGDIVKFCAFYKIDALAELPASMYADAISRLEARKKP